MKKICMRSQFYREIGILRVELILTLRLIILASPPLVVAYALAGNMNFDLYRTPLGKDKNGKDIFLKDIWPSNREIEDLMLTSLNADMFIKRYSNVSEGPKRMERYKYC